MYGDMSRYARGNEKQTISDGIFDDIDSDLTRSARLWKFGCKCCERLVSLNVKNEVSLHPRLIVRVTMKTDDYLKKRNKES